MNIFKQITLILSVLCPVFSAYSMQGAQVPSLEAQCCPVIANNYTQYSPEDIAQLPDGSRNVILRKIWMQNLGIMQCDCFSYFGCAMLGERRTGAVYAIAMTTDNKIITGTTESKVYIWEKGHRLRATCVGHTEPIKAIVVTGDNKIISASCDKTLRMWDAYGKQLAVFEGHSDSVTSVAITSDNKIISGSYDKTVRVWDLEGKQLAVFEGHSDPVIAVAVTQDNLIVSASYDKTVRIWDIEGNQVASFEGNYDPLIAITPDNKIVVGAADSIGLRGLRMWDTSGNFIRKLVPNCKKIKKFAVTHDNKIVLACEDGNVYIYNMYCNQLAICQRFSGEDTDIRAFAVTSDNKILIGCLDHSGRAYDMNFLMRFEKMNAQQSMHLIQFFNDCSPLTQRDRNMDDEWKIIKAIVNGAEVDTKTYINERAKKAVVEQSTAQFPQQSTISTPIGLLQKGELVSTNADDSQKLETYTRVVDKNKTDFTVSIQQPSIIKSSLLQKIPLAGACIALGLAGWFAYNTFAGNSHDVHN